MKNFVHTFCFNSIHYMQFWHLRYVIIYFFLWTENSNKKEQCCIKTLKLLKQILLTGIYNTEWYKTRIFILLSPDKESDTSLGAALKTKSTLFGLSGRRNLCQTVFNRQKLNNCYTI